MASKKNDFDTLKKDFENLASDISTTWEHMLDMGRSEAGLKKDQIEKELKSKFDKLKTTVENLKTKGSKVWENPPEVVSAAKKGIEENPWIGVAIAFGFGVVLGKLIEKLQKSE